MLWTENYQLANLELQMRKLREDFQQKQFKGIEFSNDIVK